MASEASSIIKVAPYSFRIVRVLGLKAQVIYLHLLKEKHLCTSILNDVNINTKSKTDSELSGVFFPPSKLGRLVVNILRESELIFREISKTFLSSRNKNQRNCLYKPYFFVYKICIVQDAIHVL